LPPLTTLRSGAFGRASFSLGSRTALTIPASAVTEHGQMQSVMVAEKGVARTRLITTGQKDKGLVEALSGLAAGDSVIFPVTRDLADGAAIEAGK
jgi:hypothetical protein